MKKPFECSDFPSHLKPYESNEEKAVALNFNYWCDIGVASSVTVADISDLIASLCAANSPLPQFLDPSFNNDSINNIVLCVVTGAARSRTPFLTTCSSVPVCFSKRLSFRDENDSSTHVSPSDVLLATSLLLWPEVPSLYFNNHVPSSMYLFSEFRLLFSAYHTDWKDEIYLQSDVGSLVALSCALEVHKCTLKILPADVYGTFTRKSDHSKGYFIFRDNGTLHFFFSGGVGGEKEYIVMNKMEVSQNEEDIAENMFKLHFRSTLASQKSDVILCLSLLDVKASKYSTMNMLAAQNFNAAPNPQSCANAPNKMESDLAHMSTMFLECSKQFPNGFENAICSSSSMEMLGFSLVDDETGFVSTSSWSVDPIACNSNSSGNISCHEELEDGEEIEENVATKPDLISLTLGKLLICAMDCEMCCTDSGIELTRISVLCPTNGLILDTLVKPDRPITNYNFEYSGIDEEMMSNVSTTINRL